MTNNLHPIRPALFEQVSPAYVHTQKIAQPTNPIRAETFSLKWYLVYPAARTFTQQEVQIAQSMLLTEVDQGKLMLHHEVGFAIQHRCTGADILYVCSWRDNNEVWETIYTKSVEADSTFVVAQRAAKTGTFCVWVIPIVAHEQQAWLRYLRSARDETAQLAYFTDQLSAVVG